MKKLQHPRGTTLANDDYIGLEAQLTVDTDRWELRLHDAETPGGHRILNLEQLLLLFMSKDSEFGEVVFGEDDKGVLTRIGNRQYALRSLIGVGGVKIGTDETLGTLNPKGTTADFYIGFTESSFTQAGNILWAGVSTGDTDAIEIEAPAGWVRKNGALIAFQCHANLVASATLQVNIDGVEGVPHLIRSAAGGVNTHLLCNTNNQVTVMYINGSYYIVNRVNSAEMEIAPIAGLTALTVGAALVELAARTNDSEDETTSFLQYKFANLSQAAAFSGGNYNIPLLTGENRLVRGSVPGLETTQGTGSNRQTVYPAAFLSFNGVTIGGHSGGRTQPGTGYSALGIIERVVNTIYYWPIREIALANFGFGWTANAIFAKANRIDCGIASGSVVSSGTSVTGNHWTYSNVGTLVV